MGTYWAMSAAGAPASARRGMAAAAAKRAAVRSTSATRTLRLRLSWTARVRLRPRGSCPKKPPTNADRLSDARLIRYASSLLTEINNGKLYATIKTFCRRSVAEASAKARHSGRMHQQSSYAHSKATSLKYIPPAWVQWKDAAGLARAHNERDREEQILRAILEIERGLSGRLRRIERFPRAEIMALRREGAVGMGMYCPEQHAPDSADSDADDSDTDDRGGGTLLRELGWSRRKEALIEHVYLQATASPGSNAPSAHSLGVMSPSRFDLLAGVRSSG
mmetsp:Transcript_14373/g.43113  ORF Transcript_14373/g.43113 Transcript_14373/m.43113 type:complete len:278 (+) Transcript_14373:890-1723(+)